MATKKTVWEAYDGKQFGEKEAECHEYETQQFRLWRLLNPVLDDLCLNKKSEEALRRLFLAHGSQNITLKTLADVGESKMAELQQQLRRETEGE